MLIYQTARRFVRAAIAESAMATWVRKGYGAGDFTHPTSWGADKLGKWIYSALMDAYVPIREDHPSRPVLVYDVCKVAAEGNNPKFDVLWVEGSAVMNRLADQFESDVGEIITMVSTAASQLEASSTVLSGTANTVEMVSQRASGASGEASGNVHSVAAASEELASSVTEISR